MKKWNVLSGIVLATFAWGIHAQDRCEDFVSSAWANTRIAGQDVAVKLGTALDCEAQTRPLTRLGAQHLVLKRVGVRLGATSALRYHFQAGANPYDLTKGHQLLLPIQAWRAAGRSLDSVFATLAEDIFPQLISNKIVALSFDAVVNQAIDFSDTPTAGFVEKTPNYYAGSLSEPFDFFLASSTEFPALISAVSSEEEWRALQAELNSYKTCPTRCLLRMEKRVLQGLFIVLGRHELVHKIFNGNYPELRPARLPKMYGCNDSFLDRPTGAFMSYQINTPYYFDYGLPAFPGRTLYIQAVNYPAVTDGIMRGQNGIVRSISAAALADLRTLGGFGANKELAHELEPRMANWNEEVVDKRFSGASKEMIRYWMARRAGRDKDAEAIINRPVFNEISFSEGKSLRWWVEFGYRRNPGTPYQIFGLDYGFHPSKSGRDSIYDRMSLALKNW